MDTPLTPKVSVLMPAYNAAEYLNAAIESILNQTFVDFEFIIVNDGSTDKTEEIVLSYQDIRIRYIKNEENLGLIQTLNKGLSLCQGEYIARMDADDIAVDTRLEKQVAYLDQHKNVAVCGTWFYFFSDKNKSNIREIKHTVDPNNLKLDMLLFDQIGHPTAMIRKDILDKYHLSYNKDYKHAEDYKLWIDILKYSDIVNIPEFLLYYRVHHTNVSLLFSVEQQSVANKIKKEYLEFLLKHSIEDDCFAVFFRKRKIKDWCCFLRISEELFSVFKEYNISNCFLKKYLVQLFKYNYTRTNILKIPLKAYSSELYKMFSLKQKIKLVIKSILN